MPHYLITGMTESGKTTLACSQSHELRKLRKVVCVLDMFEDERWSADYIATSLTPFRRHTCISTREYLFIEEAGSLGKFNDYIEWLLVRGRHLGHSVTLSCQDLTQVSPIMRNQASICYMFATDERSVDLIGRTFNKRQELEGMPPLARGEFLRISRFAPVQKYAIDFRTGRVRLLSVLSA